MNVSLSGVLLAGLLFFGHLIAVAVVSLLAYAGMNVARLQPEIQYLFWPSFLSGTLGWFFAAKKLVSTNAPFSEWCSSACLWYGLLMVGGLVVGVILQRRKL